MKIVTFKVIRAFSMLLFASAIAATTILVQIRYSAAQDNEAPEADANGNDEMTEAEPEIELPLPLFGDLNGNGVVEIDAFGDSITRGVGDFISPGEDVESVGTPGGEAGYPLRIELLLGTPVSNLGDPGERLSVGGLERFAVSQPRRRPDLVIISGGTNDAIDRTPDPDFQRSVQTMINIAQTTGTLPVLATTPGTCCNAAGFNDFIISYNNTLRTLAAVNELAIADTEHGYDNTCGGDDECFLLNQPEGVHPNESGYDVSAEIILATLLNIDIFAPDGPTLLEQALGLTPGSTLTIPDPIPQTPAS